LSKQPFFICFILSWSDDFVPKAPLQYVELGPEQETDNKPTKAKSLQYIQLAPESTASSDAKTKYEQLPADQQLQPAAVATTATPKNIAVPRQTANAYDIVDVETDNQKLNNNGYDRILPRQNQYDQVTEPLLPDTQEEITMPRSIYSLCMKLVMFVFTTILMQHQSRHEHRRAPSRRVDRAQPPLRRRRRRPQAMA
jgi:hypothetical protein